MVFFNLKPTILVDFYLIQIDILFVHVIVHVYLIGTDNENEVDSGI